MPDVYNSIASLWQILQIARAYLQRATSRLGIDPSAPSTFLEKVGGFLAGILRKSGRTTHSGSYSWFPGDDEPPNVVIIRLVYETILATDDLETCLANFRFNQLWP